MKTGGATPLNTAGKSFTLVEMLVVISIIAILAALLLPEIGTVKDRVKAVTCAHNEKRMGEAFGSYLNDNQGFYPYVYPACMNDTNNGALDGCALGNVSGGYGGDCGGGYGWNIALTPYYECARTSFTIRIECNMCAINCGWGACENWGGPIDQDIVRFAPFMQCPSNPWQIPLGTPSQCPPNSSWYDQNFAQPSSFAGGGGNNWHLFPTTYAMNGDGFPVTFGSGACNKPAGFNKCVNQADIQHPSSLALIGEMPWCCVVAPPSASGSFGLNFLPGAGWPWMSADRVALANSAQDLSHTWTNLTRFAYCNGYMAAWHGKRMNTLFPDGHVEQISQPTLTNNSAQYLNDTTTTEPGWIFFNDGKAKNWYLGQFPSHNLPPSYQYYGP